MRVNPMPTMRDSSILTIHRRRILNRAKIVFDFRRPSVNVILRRAKHVLLYDLKSGRLECLITDEHDVDPTLNDGTLEDCFVVSFHPQHIGVTREWVVENISRLHRGDVFQPPALNQQFLEAFNRETK